MQDGKIFDSEELEQMRLQYASLKEDLEKQKIINGKMMESVFRKNIGILDTDRKIGIAGGLVAVPLVFAVCIIQGLDMWIAVVLGAVFLAQTVAYLMLYRRLGPVGNGQENVLDTAVGIRKFRKGYCSRHKKVQERVYSHQYGPVGACPGCVRSNGRGNIPCMEHSCQGACGCRHPVCDNTYGIVCRIPVRTAGSQSVRRDNTAAGGRGLVIFVNTGH